MGRDREARADEPAGKAIDVAVAVLLRHDGFFLLGQRAPDTVFAGYWEFPGGKCESGEAPRQALARELAEELGIRVRHARRWITRDYAYPHARVRLHFFRVSDWDGEVNDHVHAALSWQHPDRITVSPLLPANGPVLRALALPDFYGITRAGQVGVARQLAELEAAIASGLRLVQLREQPLPPHERIAFASEAVAICRAGGARVLVNTDVSLAAELGADGVHLNAEALALCRERPPLPLVAASCHDAGELAAAASLDLDFAVLGPLRSTASHPERPALGWQRFAALVEGCPLPVYALGGLRRADLATALEHGAHGIAAIRAAWGTD